MRLIPVKQATTLLKKMCTTKPPYSEIKLLTAKKDRSLTIRNDLSILTLIENGYLHLTKEYSLIDPSQCKHDVQAAFKKEFPRSNRAYLNAIK